MKKIASFVLVCCIVSFGLTGCAPQKAESPKVAITAAKAMETTQEQINYLMGQAKAFYNSKEFQGTVDIAQYVLRYLDKDSQAAKALLDKAKDALTAAAKGAAGDVKKKLGF